MSKKILLVEDEAILAMAETRMLEKHGFEVTAVYSGEKALETVVSDPGISLILMDIDLGGGMDGTEAAQRILEKFDLPIVFLSSHTEPEVVKKTEGITSYGYIVKDSGETVLLASMKMAFKLFDTNKKLAPIDDITDRKQAEEEVRQSKERYSSLFTYMEEGFALHEIIRDGEGRPVDYRFLDVNPAFETSTGLKREDIIGKTVLEVLPETEPLWIKLYGEVALNGKSIRFQEYSASLKRYYQVTAFSTRLGQFAVLAADISGQKRVEENLRITLDSIGDAVIATDGSGRVVRMNPVAERLCGWRKEEAQGRDLGEVFYIVDSHTRERVDTPVGEVMRSGDIVGLANDTVLISNDGNEYQIADSAAPIKDADGKINGVVLVFRDVTVKYKKAQELRASEEKYRKLAESVGAVLWEYDIALDRWTYVAPQVRDLLGYDPSEWKDPQF
ncbi:MAG: PAS domain S-box protein [Spirochaetia bacterium]